MKIRHHANVMSLIDGDKMATVRFTSALKRFFPSLSETVVEAGTIRDVIEGLDQHYPGLSGYLVDDTGKLRPHVNVFVKNQLISDRDHLSDAVTANDRVVIFQALSGG